MARRLLPGLMCCAAAAIAPNAQAQAANADAPARAFQPYVQASFGALRLNSPDNTGTTMNLSGSTSKAAARVVLGAQLNPTFGVEAAWYQLPATTVLTPSGGADYHGSAWTTSLTATLPLQGDVAAVARLGGGRSSVHVEVPATGYASDSRRNLAVWGLGARYRVNDRIAVAIDYDNLGAVGKYALGNHVKAELVSVGVQFKF